MKPIVKIILLFVIPILSAVFTYFILHLLLLTPYNSKSTETKLIIVSKDAKQTGKILENEKIIKNWWSFYIISKIRSLKRPLIAGEFELSPSMTPLQIVKKINNGELKFRELVISAGDTITNVIDKLSNIGIENRQALEDKFYNKNYIIKLGIPSGNLEGYMFPAIYTFSFPITTEEILKKIITEGNKHWLSIYDDQTASLKMDKRQILILASIIEKECIELGAPRDQLTLRSISCVYHNRLKRGLPLNAISTIYYFDPNAPRPLNDESKKKYSPFNTFANTGLPPAPICSPGNTAIKAALYPTSDKYITFSFDAEHRGIIFENETIIPNAK